MRLLVDECLSRTLVGRLRRDGHDVSWMVEDAPGGPDADILDRAVAEDRILISEDWDFGELVFRRARQAVGVVMVVTSDDVEASSIADRVAQRLETLGEAALRGRFTVIETHRTRQRDLPSRDGAH